MEYDLDLKYEYDLLNFIVIILFINHLMRKE